MVDHSCMAKPYLWLWQQHEVIRNLHLCQDLKMLLVIQINLFALNIAPAVRSNLIAMHVTEDVCLVATAIDIELVEVADKAMVCARLRCILWIQIDPLLLNRLKLSQVIKIDSTFASVSSKEEDAVFEGKRVGTGP